MNETKYKKFTNEKLLIYGMYCVCMCVCVCVLEISFCCMQ